MYGAGFSGSYLHSFVISYFVVLNRTYVILPIVILPIRKSGNENEDKTLMFTGNCTGNCTDNLCVDFVFQLCLLNLFVGFVCGLCAWIVDCGLWIGLFYAGGIDGVADMADVVAERTIVNIMGVVSVVNITRVRAEAP